jgi:predicted transcriptional regulator
MGVMSTHIVTVEEELMISDAIEIMNKNKIGRLIVVNNDNIPVGIVTRTDLLDKIAGLK